MQLLIIQMVSQRLFMQKLLKTMLSQLSTLLRRYRLARNLVVIVLHSRTSLKSTLKERRYQNNGKKIYKPRDGYNRI